MENDENSEARVSRIQRIPRGGPKFGPGQISYTFFNVHYFAPVQTCTTKFWFGPGQISIFSIETLEILYGQK